MPIALKKLYRRLWYLRREVEAYLLYCLRPTPQDQLRVVILAQGRTGSTLLEDLICASGHFSTQTGYFADRGELLNKARGEILFPLPFIRGLARKRPGRNFIFHVKPYHLTRDRRRPVDPHAFMKALYDDGWRIIYLRRRNKIRQALSNVVAEARGAYLKVDAREETLSVRVDVDEFVRHVRSRIAFEQTESDMLRGLEFLEVVYEDGLADADDHQATADRIMEYLGLPRRKVSTRYRKINARSMRSVISNYDELRSRMVEEGWGEFL